VRALLQRVTEATVEARGVVVGQIGFGWLILLGVGADDSPAIASRLADKVATLRAFEDAAGKTNLAAADVGAQMLVVSQFTLYADTSRGRRPSFTRAASPERARALCVLFAQALRSLGFVVATGEFGAHMQVRLVNDGPFTLLLEEGPSP
jgi:D-tyrosyl-tRNA(Tyr) deacylase